MVYICLHTIIIGGHFNASISKLRDKPETIGILEAKTYKGMHQLCIQKSCDRHLSIPPR